jgi:Na+-transporting NADH:ubiquinone oxidoreductase subunit A
MKISKGYLPRIAGRPASGLDAREVVSPLHVPLVLAHRRYTPLVKPGQDLKSGDSLAELDSAGGKLFVPAPYTGTVEQLDQDKGFIVLNVSDPNPQPWPKPTFADPTVLEYQTAREHLATAGIWPSIWDSACSETPGLDGSQPKAIVVKAVVAEPFRARGNVILENNLELFLQGLSYLERLGADYAPIYLILTHASHPLAQQIKKTVAGLAWVRPMFVPLTYPLSNNRYLWRCLQHNEQSLQRSDSVWFLGTQAVLDIARCLGQGLVPYQRIISMGGPGYPQGQHLTAPIGTRLSKLCDDLANFDGLRVLRGGIFTGAAVDPHEDAVGHLDDGFTFLPEGTERQFLSFMRAGFDKPSYTPAYFSRLRPKKSLATNTSLRGEPRACIACGYCEEVCPVDIMPHLIWRFLSKDLLEEAQAAGAQICVECGLCSYVCPSKIELAEEISKGIKQIHEELTVEAEKQEVDL